MKTVIQRVTRAAVTIDGHSRRSIDQGVLILLGVGKDDREEDCRWLARKIAQMRIFKDDKGKMNLSLLDIDGQALVISQFTLFANTRKGNRPSFNDSASPEKAVPLYEEFTRQLSSIIKKPVQTGEFGAHMDVELVNDGPVTIELDSVISDKS